MTWPCSSTGGPSALVEWHDEMDLVVRVHAPADTSTVTVRRAGADVPAQRVSPQTWEARLAPPREPDDHQ